MANTTKSKTGKRLTNKELAWLQQKLLDGYKDQEIKDLFAKEFEPKTITYQISNYYRKKFAVEIRECEEEAIEEVKYQGYCKMTTRIKAIERIVAKQVKAFEDEKMPYNSKHSRILTDLQKSIAMLQNHLHENENIIETSDGSRVITTVVEIPTISEVDPINGD